MLVCNTVLLTFRSEMHVACDEQHTYHLSHYLRILVLLAVDCSTLAREKGKKNKNNIIY